MSNCPHRRPGGIVGSYVDENEPCAQCEEERAKSKAFWSAVRDVAVTIGMGAAAVAIVWCLMTVLTLLWGGA